MDSKDVVNNFISSQIFTNHQGLTQAENVDKSLKKVVDNLYAGKQETDAQLATIGSKVGNKLDNVEAETTTEEEEEIIFKRDNGTIVGKIGVNGAEFPSVKVNNKEVLTEHQDISNLATKTEVSAKANTSYVNTELAKKQKTLTAGDNITIAEDGTISAQGGVGDLPISGTTTQEESDDVIFRNDNGTEDYAKIGNYGIKAKAYLDLNGNPIGGGASSWLSGKNIYTLGDSLSEQGKWQTKLCELCGCTYDKANNYITNYGGSITFGDGHNGNGRAKKLAEIGQTKSVDVIFYQDVNDMNYIGASIDTTQELEDDFAYKPKWNLLKSTVALFCKQSKESSVFATSTESVNDFKANIIARTTDLERHSGAVYRCRYGSVSKTIKITSKATSNGSIMLTVGGQQFGVSVSTTDTIADICKNIEAWDYSGVGYTDTLDATNNQVIFANSGNAVELTFSANSTGVTATITDSSSVSSKQMVYCSSAFDDTNWATATNWKDIFSVDLFSIYRGQFEYLQKTFPQATIIMLCMPSMSVSSVGANDPKLFFNNDYQKKGRSLRIIQTAMANLYGIRVVDYARDGQISPSNALNYYPTSNVHPTDAGYAKWAEEIAKLIQ